MAPIAILSDIHGNLPAFEAVLRDVDKSSAEQIFFGGDIIGYGASPKECLDKVRSLGGRCVIGNHEFYSEGMALQGIENLEEGWEENPVLAGVVLALRTLSGEDLEWIWGLPRTIVLDKETLLCHAGLESPSDWPYINDLESAEPSLALMKAGGQKLGFFGHVHRLGIYPSRKCQNRIHELPANSETVITVGSVGQPRDHFDNRAAWVLWDPDARTVEFRKVEYDWKLAAQQIIEANLPVQSAFRLRAPDFADTLRECDDDEL